MTSQSRTDTTRSPKVLLVDDERNLVTMLAKILKRHGYDVLLAHDGEEGLEVLRQNMPDPSASEAAPVTAPVEAILTDLRMPKVDGHEFLRRVRESYADLPVVVLTGHGSIQSAVDAMKQGAFDYLIKPANPEELLLVLQRALEMRDLRAENRLLRARAGSAYTVPSTDVVGSSSATRRAMEMVRAVSGNRTTVLITGESGTGKELVARAIHDSGPCARYPFIAVNCGALSETLLESQLFGHRKGAFTGAVADHIGFFQAAEGGTLFLDEISEMSPHLQVKLLRALQEREIISVGDNTPIRINVRIVCASNRDLEAEVRAGRFREDLYYRLNIVNIALQPLRARPDDIPDLVGHFILRFAKEYDVAPRSVQPDAMQRLVEYPWPGNIRELQNVIERTFALSTKPTITLADLPHQLFRSASEALASKPNAAMAPVHARQAGIPDVHRAAAVEHPGGIPGDRADAVARPGEATHPEESEAVAGSAAASVAYSQPFVPRQREEVMTLEEMEKRQIVEALRRSRGKKVEAARILGIDRKRLYRKMKKYDLS